MDHAEEGPVSRVCFCRYRQIGSALRVSANCHWPHKADRNRSGYRPPDRPGEALPPGVRRRGADGRHVRRNYRELKGARLLRAPQGQGGLHPEDRPAQAQGLAGD